MKYVVGRHARDRFKQRYRIKFPAHYFLSEHLTDSLILNLVENGTRITWWECVPFYKNKVESKYGPTIAILSKKKGIVFLCTPIHHNVTMIRTVVKNFDPRV